MLGAMTVNVYSQFFSAECEYNGVRRRAALVSLCSDSEQGHITYSASVTFFPHVDDEDYAVSYDAFQSQVLYEGKGRRSKKKETVFLEGLHPVIDGLSGQIGAKVFWDKPLRPESRG